MNGRVTRCTGHAELGAVRRCSPAITEFDDLSVKPLD
jgi:hypothetical protein